MAHLFWAKKCKTLVNKEQIDVSLSRDSCYLCQGGCSWNQGCYLGFSLKHQGSGVVAASELSSVSSPCDSELSNIELSVACDLFCRATWRELPHICASECSSPSPKFTTSQTLTFQRLPGAIFSRTNPHSGSQVTLLLP